MFKPENDDNALAAMAGLPKKQGLSKEDRDCRDMFAAAALTGLLASLEDTEEVKILAAASFILADEMLKASKK